jgi:hypothetical protein
VPRSPARVSPAQFVKTVAPMKQALNHAIRMYDQAVDHGELFQAEQLDQQIHELEQVCQLTSHLVDSTFYLDFAGFCG